MKLILGLFVVVLVGAACSATTCSDCGLPPVHEAIVKGQVTMDTGGPAPLAAMFAQATPTVACVQGTLSSWGRADSAGRYRLEVFGASVGSGDSGCVFVGALFPPTQAGKDTVVGPFRMKFANPPLDSVTVDIVIHH